MLCGKPAINEIAPNRGDWIEFSDYRPQDTTSLSHPPGLEYFCDEHVEAAKLLASMPSTEVLTALEEQFGRFPKYNSGPHLSRPWWQRLFSK